MTEEPPMDEPEDAGSEMLLVEGGGGGTLNDCTTGEEGCPSAPSSTPAFVVIVNGMGIKIDVLSLESSSPSVPADEDDRDTPKNSLKRSGQQKKTVHILRFCATSKPLRTASYRPSISFCPGSQSAGTSCGPR
jgi:hypothetical protein